ncbi:MAG: cobalt-zinc-cadmium efflux system membrane fusion protein [Saprospiraceae bacterium]|jgi:cobalt-zinc-cadmium efflux system membrane fusion protein|tara:strand:- start:406 stop:1926 length:1521 start_codon:yes stop_codon:yes gene_type:complete
MNKLLYLILGICLVTGFISCQDHGPEGHSHDGEDAHALEVEYPTVSFTAWTDKTELFVEYPVLTVGKSSRFAAHFSSMQNFKPISEGVCRVELLQNGISVAIAEVKNPNSPGIFLPEMTPSKSGKCDLVFYLDNENVSDTIVIKDVSVYESEQDALQNFRADDDDGHVAFSKEQAWKVDFALAPVKWESIPNIIHTSGEVLPIESDEVSISASTSGIVIFKNSSLIEGQNIGKGTSLFVVNNDQMISSNLSEKYAVLKANLLQSQKNIDRSKELVSKGIISQKEYDERNRQYEVDLASYQTMTKNYSSGGMTLKAPIAGILKNLHVVNGQYVSEGQSIATISKNKHLLIEAEVSQKHFKDLPKVVSANIKLPWRDDVVSIDNYNGKLVTTALTSKDHYIPVLFKIDNKGDIVPGTFLEIYLKTSDEKQELVIPRSALLQEYDMYFVYIMIAGESFEKRHITIGIDDGKKVQVLSGLEENEMVVTAGVYAIKMASMSSSIPAHGHEH